MSEGPRVNVGGISRGKYSDPHTRTAFTAVDHGVLLRRFLSFFLSFFLSPSKFHRCGFHAVLVMSSDDDDDDVTR